MAAGADLGYAVDTNCFIDLQALLVTDEQRDHIWDGLTGLIEAGRLSTVDEVLTELERNDQAECLARLAPYRRTDFVVSKRDLVRDERALSLLRRVIRDFRRMSGWGTARGGADPYLIVLAHQRSLTVVAQEGRFAPKTDTDDRRKKRQQIPDACRSLGVECIDLMTLLIREEIAHI